MTPSKISSGGAPDQFVRRRRAARLGRFRWLWVTLAIGALSAFVAWVLLFSSWLAVSEVAVSGERTIAAKKVRTAAGVQPGRPLARVDVDAVTERVEQLPRVQSATVDRSWPGTVAVHVEERTAVAVVLEDGRKRALDRDGVLFKTVQKVPKQMPTVSLTATGGGRADALREVAEVVAALDGPLARKVKRIEAASMDAIELELRNGDTVHWGSAEFSERKARVLKVLLERPAEVYDVSAPGRPTTRS